MLCKNCDNEAGLRGNRHIRNRRYTCSNYRGGIDVAIDFTDLDYDSYSSSYSPDSSSDNSSSSSDSSYSSE